MTPRRDPDRLIHDFLMEGQTELEDQVYDAVRARIDTTRQRAVIGSWTTPGMNRYIKVGLAAAAVVIIAVVGFQLLGGSNVGSPAPTQTPGPTATPDPRTAGLPIGLYALTVAGDVWDVGMTVSIAATDWLSGGDDGDGILVKRGNANAPDGAGLIVFTGELEVYGDPCRWSTTRPDPMTGPTVDDLIAALAVQAGRNATEPVDVMVDGYLGRSIQLSVPADANFAECDIGQFRSWGPTGADRYHQDPGQIDRVWVVDVDGTRAVIDAGWYEETSAADRAELEALLGSLTFDSP